MLALIFSPAALDDIREIYGWIELESLDAADNVVNRIRDECLNLRSSPLVGHLRTEPFLPENTRSVHAYSYLIFYRTHGDVVHIGRVIHGARLIDEVLFQGVDF